MDKYEMESQLRAGKEAIDISIVKWRDLKKEWVEMEGEDHFDTCALCHVHAKNTGSCNKCPLVKMEGGMACDAPHSPFRVAIKTKNAVGMLRALSRAKHYVEEQKVISAKLAATKKRQKAADARKRKLAAIPKVGDKVKIKIQWGDRYNSKSAGKEYLETRTYTVKDIYKESDGTFSGHFILNHEICFASVKLTKVK